MREIVKRIPGASSAYHHTRQLLNLVYEGWLVNRRRHFDRLLAAGEFDAGAQLSAQTNEGRLWDFESAFNRERYQRMLSAVEHQVGTPPWGDVLEVGCGNGVFTEMLAQRSPRVVAVDISPFGCARTRERCAAHGNVEVSVVDLRKDAIEGEYDIAFAMDVLEYFHGASSTRAVVAKLESAVRIGGYVAITATRLPEEMRRAWWVKRMVEGGDAIAEFLDGKDCLRLVRRERCPKYLVAVFQKVAG